MFTAQNPLETSLMKAATEPEHRAQFYRDFLAGKVLILPEGNPVIVDGVLQAGSQLSLEHIRVDGKTVLPCFTSLACIQTFTTETRQTLTLDVRSLLEMTLGATLLLNPGSDFGKEFLPHEVSAMLDGSIFKPAERHVVKQDAQILIGQPKIYPTKLVEALQRLFAKLPEVRSAYLAYYHNPAREKAPGLLIAIDAAEKWDHIISESGICAQGLTPDHDHVDFMQLSQSGLQNHFKKEKPFYKAEVSFFKRLFS